MIKIKEKTLQIQRKFLAKSAKYKHVCVIQTYMRYSKQNSFQCAGKESDLRNYTNIKFLNLHISLIHHRDGRTCIIRTSCYNVKSEGP